MVFEVLRGCKIECESERGLRKHGLLRLKRER